MSLYVRRLIIRYSSNKNVTEYEVIFFFKFHGPFILLDKHKTILLSFRERDLTSSKTSKIMSATDENVAKIPKSTEEALVESVDKLSIKESGESKQNVSSFLIRL